MLKFRSGMTEAEFEEIYDLFWGKLYTLAYNYFRDRATAQELVQDVFVNLWLKREELAHIQDVNAYIFRCMRNRIYDQFDTIAFRERLVRNATQQFNEIVHSTQETVEYEETLALLQEEIAKLPATTQTIFRLSRFDRYTNEEIATRLQVSCKAVEYHITIALKKLRMRFEDHLIYFFLVVMVLGN